LAHLIKDLFNQAVSFLDEQDVFYGHGVALAEDEVVLLFMHVFNVDFQSLNQLAETRVDDKYKLQIESILKQRVQQRCPMAYLVGFSVFAGLKFKIDRRALIPRSPFVELIDKGFSPWLSLDGSVNVLDLCTGSGCIGLAIAHYFPAVQVDLIDLSTAALSLAIENTNDLQLNKRVKCIESDLFAQVQQRYDLIVSNPPYIAEEEYLGLPKEFVHEPKMALVSRYQGMELPIKILQQAADYLTDDGYLFLEVGYNDEVLTALFPKVAFDWIKFELGGQGICVFSRADLLKYRDLFNHFLESHVA